MRSFRVGLVLGNVVIRNGVTGQKSREGEDYLSLGGQEFVWLRCWMVYLNDVEIFLDGDDFLCGEEVVSQMLKFLVNEGVWLEVRQFRKEKGVVLDDGLVFREG